MKIFGASSTGLKPEIVPSTGFLICLNGLLFFSASLLGVGRVGLIIVIPIVIGFMALSLIPQLVFRRVVEKNRILTPVPRIAIYTSPFWGLLTLSLLLPASPQKPNQESPALSPSGNLQVTASAPAMGWTFEIETVDKKGRWEILKNFSSKFNVYWAWDSDDRFWVHNSDDGSVMFWTEQGDNWRGYHWPDDVGPDGGISRETQPPELLYPDYAKGNRG